MDTSLETLTQNQKERLAFIEFRAYFLGEVRRTDVTTRFGVATAAATRDIALYRSLADGNIVLDPKTKAYVVGGKFSPIFKHPVDRVLSALSQGFGEGIGGQSRPLVPCEIPATLNFPNVAVLAPITQAIHRKKVVRISYHSFSSGESEREIVPFSLANNGLRWHVRAYDRRRGRFIDFVLTRIACSELLEQSRIEEHEEAINDIQWNRIVSLDLVPHPAKSAHEIIAMDYGMALPERVLKVNVRAALAGYFLRQWSVDCSPSHSLDGPEVRLWLRNPVALYGVDSASLVPGYTPVDELGAK